MFVNVKADISIQGVSDPSPVFLQYNSLVSEAKL